MAPWLRILALFGLLWGFLVAIGLLENAFRILGEGSVGGLFEGVTHPLAGLAVGVMATVLVQSSSVTTATIVALCGSGQLPLTLAVPMVMGANIGTTVTNTLVSLASVRRSVEFRRAFACATVHDVFNVCSVAILLPLELATGFLRRSAEWFSAQLHSLGSGGGTYQSPVKAAVKVGTRGVIDVLEGWGAQGTTLAVTLFAVALVLIFFCLAQITRNMRILLVARIEAALNEVLGRSGVLAIIVGVLITVAVQSSSITTSLLVPLCAAGVLRLENAYPITLGANLGTTVTAFMASLAAEGDVGLTIALVHLFFNVAGTIIFFPVPVLRRFPIRTARRLAMLAVANKFLLFLYIATIFVILPVLGILVYR